MASLRGLYAAVLAVSAKAITVNYAAGVQGGDSSFAKPTEDRSDPSLGARPPSVAIVRPSIQAEKEKD
jgi:hypothetical protein